MKVILVKDVSSLGRSGAVVEVKEGYARNYLLPRGLAREATEGAVRAQNRATRAAEHRRTRQEEETQHMVESLNGVGIEIEARAGGDGRLFGTITPQAIAEALAARGFAISKKQIEIEHPIRLVGPHTVGIRLPAGRIAHVEVRVVPLHAPAR